MKNTTPHITSDKQYPTGRFNQIGEHLRVLTRDESTYIAPLTSFKDKPKLNAIAIPTHHHVRYTKRVLKNILAAAAKHNAGIVIFLCSDDAAKEDIAKLALSVPALSWVAIDWRKGEEYSDAWLATSQSYLSRGKNFNVTEKRNFILELARLMSWSSVMFLDDDIEITAEHMDKAADLLEAGAEVVGFNAREFPDHSVVVHANQVINSPTDVFIGVGAMAIKIDVQFLSFFPNMYNNDWLFSLPHGLTSDNGLVWAGTVKQKPYKPFRTLTRAEREEPGDILAEGLFRLVMESKSKSKLPETIDERLTFISRKADRTYWEKEITKRVDFIQATLESTKRHTLMKNKRRITRSLHRSLDVINGYDGFASLGAENFTAWIQDWVRDLHTWNKHLASLKPVSSVEAALGVLGYDENLLYGKGRNVVNQEEIPNMKRRHILFEYLKNIGEDKFNDVMFSHDNNKFMQEFAAVKGNNLLRILRGVDRLRYDRPLTDTGAKPSMTVIMFVSMGESSETVIKSVNEIARQSKGDTPLQLTLWVYAGGNERKQQLQSYRNVLVSELLPHVQDTCIILSSGLLTVRGNERTVDNMVRDISVDTLMSYWKLGRRPLPGHHFLVVNSKNEPLRFGTLKQLLKHEHAIADKSAKAYLKRYHVPIDTKLLQNDSKEVVVARDRLGEGTGWRSTWRENYTKYLSTLTLSYAMQRAGLKLQPLDDLALTIEFHDPKGWISIQDNLLILGVQVEYMQSLPGDIYGIVRQIGELTQKQLGKYRYKGCMIIVCGKPDDPWSELQAFRRSIVRVIAETHSTSDIVFSSLVYRRTDRVSHKKSRRIAKAMCRYIYWLENHRIRQRFIWEKLDNRK